MDFALDDETPLKVQGKSKCHQSDRDTRCVSERTGFARCVFSGGSVVMLDALGVPPRVCHGYPNRDLALTAQGDLHCSSSEAVRCVTSPRRRQH